MKTGAIILARLTSSRLPGKGLKYIGDKKLLVHIVDLLKSSKSVDEIIIATSDRSSDDPIDSLCSKLGIHCYRGSMDNVALRFLEAAKMCNLSHAIRINGDNLFTNPSLIDECCSFISSEIDFISNVPNRTFPKGMSVEVVNVDFFENIYGSFELDSDFEHVTSFIYRNENNVRTKYIENNEFVDIAGVQLAIDSEYDLVLAKSMLKEGFDLGYKTDLQSLYINRQQCEKKMNFYGQHGPLLIAEIGGNHEGDFEYAKELTQLAIDSDADFVKFQIYSGNTLVNPVESPDRHKHFKKFELTKEQYVEIAEMVTQAGKKFMASIWDVKMIDWVDDYNPVYKIGSGDLLAWPLLKEVATRGKPIILSTGLATENEVVEAVEYIRKCNPIYNDKNNLAVLQCTSMYPIPKEAANLNVMQKLEEITGATKGYSDHTEGADALKVAVAMGAQVLEFHFTDSREGKEFRDHKVSLTKLEVLDLIEHIKMINILKGDSKKRPVSIEIDNGHVESFRRAVYPSRDLPIGHVISEDDLVVLRPDHGLSSKYFDELIGKKVNVDLKKYQKLSKEYFV